MEVILKLIGLVFFIILCMYAILFIQREVKREKNEKYALLRISKHVIKTLLQAEYMKQKGIPISWIVSYIKSKKNMPDKKTETTISNMVETYDIIFEEIINYIEHKNISSLLTIQRYVNRYADLDLLSIETGSKSEKEFRDRYTMLPDSPLEEGSLYKGIYAKTDVNQEDPFEVVYIPRISFKDYFS